MAEAGRPKRTFSDSDIALIEQYALDNCKTQTIADALNIPYNSLKRHFGRRLTHWRACGKVKLREYQRVLSQNHPAMAVFLGKNTLDQTDTQTIKTEAVLLVAPVDVPAVEAAAQAYKRFLAPMTKVIESKVIDSKEIENV